MEFHHRFKYDNIREEYFFQVRNKFPWLLLFLFIVLLVITVFLAITVFVLESKQ